MSKGKSRQNTRQENLFPTQYEEDFLLRTLGDTVRNSDVALSELVANAWDAGASRVSLTIPEKATDATRLIVEDDGSGLTREQFNARWMTLAYDRITHQGSRVEFPPGRTGRRRAYGRNGQGRHGLLCFGNSYEVETWRDGTLNAFRVHVSKGDQPFVSRPIGSRAQSGHGTRLVVEVQRNYPDPDRIRQFLSSKFLHDPDFTVVVNGTSLELLELEGLTERRTLNLTDPETGRPVVVEVYVVQGDSGRWKHQSGVAFWVGGRLVGTPGWDVMGVPYVDGRTRAGRRMTVIVKSDDLYDQINADWTGFRQTMLTTLVGSEVLMTINDVFRRLFASRVRETTNEVLACHAQEIRALSPGEQAELIDVTDAIANRDPLVSSDVLSAAVTGIIDAKQKGAPLALMKRILDLPVEDQEGLSRLLDEWSVRDALTVLDEIGRRIRVVEALEKLMGEKGIDEVHVLHPLVTQARWLFGPEYDSPHYASNVGLRTAVQKVFEQVVPAEAFINSRKRPDLIVLPESTLTAVATEDHDPDTGVVRFRRVLLVELKRGGFKITRKEMEQASGYAEDLMNCGLLDGAPYIHAFVVGHQLDPKTTSMRKLGENEQGRVEAVTFHQLVRTANARLFRIRDSVEQRYPDSSGDLLKKLLDDAGERKQLGIPFPIEPTIPERSGVECETAVPPSEQPKAPEPVSQEAG